LGNRRKLTMVIAELREYQRQQRHQQQLFSPIPGPSAISPMQAFPGSSRLGGGEWGASPFASSPMSFFGDQRITASPMTGAPHSPLRPTGFDAFRGASPTPTHSMGQPAQLSRPYPTQSPLSPFGAPGYGPFSPGPNYTQQQQAPYSRQQSTSPNPHQRSYTQQ
jgi:hypothetical protein